ncbi:DUF998 domain-containing protein [Flagellimonas nanhaiensis]|uniref:DUF998 domain-containing protein n=1 Tax=Flagellimonas nanhaiensis TaxID=2292706 RepID=A0A371JQ06_9FLAO|nr:DUF998 domain-containing protein [Allomuricauda nanhaiensis]RDY59599.1 DUF998 domain-containing protein [Allomuricauda nanhaiensis]
MSTQKFLWTGWAAALLFILGTTLLGYLLPDYNAISQTVSEIGKMGSPLYQQFQLFSIAVGVLVLLFALSLISFAKRNGLSVVPGVLLLLGGVAELGLAIFASPHPLHNVFGLSQTIPYMAPLFFGILWKSKIKSSFKMVSFLTFALIVLGIFLNLSPLFAPTLYPLEYYGIVQRFLLFVFYLYLAFVSYNSIFFLRKKTA